LYRGPRLKAPAKNSWGLVVGGKTGCTIGFGPGGVEKKEGEDKTAHVWKRRPPKMDPNKHEKGNKNENGTPSPVKGGLRKVCFKAGAPKWKRMGGGEICARPPVEKGII